MKKLSSYVRDSNDKVIMVALSVRQKFNWVGKNGRME